MNHLPQSLWYKVLQPEQRTLSKKSEVQPTNQGKIEITGALVSILKKILSLFTEITIVKCLETMSIF